MEFPFTFGKVVTGSQFINRKKELAQLRSNIDQGINTVLISPRRWGKSSLIKYLSKKMSKNKQLNFILIDLFRFSDELEFYEGYIKAFLQTGSAKSSDQGNLIRKSFKSLQPGISIADEASGELDVSLQWTDIERHFEEVLNLPEKLGKKRNQKFVICIDEFQSFEKFKNPILFQSRLRSIWQHHSHVVYILIGSKRHMMDRVFNSKSYPFFRFGEIMYLQKIKKKHFCRYIISTFERSGKTIPKERANMIISLAERNPYFVQQLSRYVWKKSTELVIDSDIKESLEDIIMHNAVWYLREVERMTPSQFNYLKAVVNEEKNLSGQDVIRKYKLGSSANVAKIKKVMEDREILDFWDLYPEFNDPFFKLWIRNQSFAYSSNQNSYYLPE
jgi:AAA+ ATPase superfamily predicted ATPase